MPQSITTRCLEPNEQAALADLEFELSAPHTLAEIAAHLGYTQRAVEMIEARALKKLRRWLKSTPEWAGGLRDAPALSRRTNAVFGTDGSAERRDSS